MGRAFEYRKASKEARWDKMSKLFPKLAKAIQVAAKEGGADPAMNAKLRTTIALAKANNMPKNNIEAAIKRASGKDAIDIKSLHYEARGLAGDLYMIECMSDNPTRTVANVKAILSKNKATMLQNGSLSFMFEKKAIFYLKKPNIDLEELELGLIDFGLTSLELIAGELKITGEADAYKSLSDALEARDLECEEAGIEFVAKNLLELDTDALKHHELILEKLEDDEDVHRIYSNVKLA